ncbi:MULTISPECIES: hypothetical protein [Actinomadura]|uniref:Uncharacterized protein n=1 Tax=Actinomadura yumaensis TaxID=111807 RepID=A0ABW2CBS0_9ACTN|nr:hypothetical protein [Actinomadura sp. J1-007]
MRPGEYATAEYPAVAVVEHVLCIGAGITMLAALVLDYRSLRS